eukprot:3475650-Alexandrium_andersonii.AAC.1
MEPFAATGSLRAEKAASFRMPVPSLVHCCAQLPAMNSHAKWTKGGAAPPADACLLAHRGPGISSPRS